MRAGANTDPVRPAVGTAILAGSTISAWTLYGRHI